MKHLVTLAAAAMLSGCAGLQSEPPRYDYSQEALIAPGFPVEQIDMPQGYRFVDLGSGRERQEYDRAGDQGSAYKSTLDVVWNTTQGNTAVMAVRVESVAPPSMYLPWEESDGYAFIGGQKFQYQHYQGRYQDMFDDSGYIPEGAPDCAYGLMWIAKNATARKRQVGTYTEGVTCTDMPLLNNYDLEQQREKASRLFGVQ